MYLTTKEHSERLNIVSVWRFFGKMEGIGFISVLRDEHFNVVLVSSLSVSWTSLLKCSENSADCRYR